MINSKIKIVAAASSLVLAAPLVGCSGSPEAPIPSGSQPSGSAASAPASAPEDPAASVPEALPEGSPTPPKANPAATTSGPLSGDTMPKKLRGFEPVPGEASEGEYQPNGTFVHALDSKLSVRDALPQCGKTVQVPQAKYALGASYADSTERPGNAVQFQFENDAEAQEWFKGFTSLVSKCEVVGSKPVITKTTLHDQRLSGESIWTEAGRVKGDRVLMVIVQGKDHSAKKLLAGLSA